MRLDKRVMLLAVSIVLAACAKPATPAAEFTAADEAAIRARADSIEASVRAMDWAKWAGFFSEGALFQPPNGKAVRGRANIEAWARSFPPLESFAFTNPEVHGAGSMAIYTSGIQIKMKDIPADTSKQLAVFKKSPTGTWEVVAVSFNSDLPMPAPAAPPARGTKAR